MSPVPGLVALIVLDANTIEIRRDRSVPIGTTGEESEFIHVGDTFVLKDTDHTVLKYKLSHIEAGVAYLAEKDLSQLGTRRKPRTLEVRSFPAGEAAAGTVTMYDDGTIDILIVAGRPERIRVGEPGYRETIKRVGGLKPGQTKPIK